MAGKDPTSCCTLVVLVAMWVHNNHKTLTRSLHRIKFYQKESRYGGFGQNATDWRSKGRCLCVCVCVLSSHPFWTSSWLDVQPGSHRRKVTQDFSSSTFLLFSAVRALIFLARRFQLFLSLADREVDFCVLTS